MVQEFMTQAQDQQFKDWLAHNPCGLYLNESSVGNVRRNAGGMVLHRVGCPHLGSGEGVISTTYAKAASEDRVELLNWAVEKGLTVISCSTCKPD